MGIGGIFSSIGDRLVRAGAAGANPAAYYQQRQEVQNSQKNNELIQIALDPTITPGEKVTALTRIGTPEAQQYAMALAKPANGFTLSEGQTRYDASGNPVASVAPKPQDPTGSYVTIGNKIVDKKTQQIVKDFGTEAPTGKDLITAEKTLRDDFQAQSKDWEIASNAYERALGSAQLGNEGNAAGDIALVFDFMKVLDPTSVVRETEFATVARAAGLPDRIVAAFDKVANGSVLAPEQRKNVTETLGKIFEARARKQAKNEETYTRMATGAGTNPENVLIGISRVGDVKSALEKKRQPKTAESGGLSKLQTLPQGYKNVGNGMVQGPDGKQYKIKWD